MENYRGPVPAALTGARTVDVAGLQALLAKEDALLVDVMPTQPKPAQRPVDAIWRDPERKTVTGDVWLGHLGSGRLPPAADPPFPPHPPRPPRPPPHPPLALSPPPSP